jgi:LysM repeat protein
MALPNLPRIAVMAGAIAVAAVALFFLPAILGIGGGGNPAASVRPSVAPSASVLPTEAPPPTPGLYTIKKNETLSKIATAHGITLEELLAANPQIKNPNKIAEGQQITIPSPSDAPPDQVGSSAEPSAAP